MHANVLLLYTVESLVYKLLPCILPEGTSSLEHADEVMRDTFSGVADRTIFR